MGEFCRALPNRILAEKGNTENIKENVGGIFSKLSLNEQEWERFAFFDHYKKYTRNLIATDNKTYTLVLMCWNAKEESHIHDHPSDGCWFRVCKGSVREVRYQLDEDSDCFSPYFDETFKAGQIAYMEDSLGFHKVGNPNEIEDAVTLHLYCPPFQKCKIWLDQNETRNPIISSYCY